VCSSADSRVGGFQLEQQQQQQQQQRSRIKEKSQARRRMMMMMRMILWCHRICYYGTSLTLRMPGWPVK
jgi:hypothetical protein